MVALGDVVEVKGGGTPSKANPVFWNGDIPWVSPKDMKCWDIEDAEDKITAEAIKGSATNLIPRNSILIVNRSGILKHTLPVGITRRPVAINQDLKALICGPRSDPDYIAHLVKAAEPTVLKWVRATTADNFPIENLRSLEIPLPPLDEQRRIAAILDKADTLRRKRKRALDLIKQGRDALIETALRENSHGQAVALKGYLEFMTTGGRSWSHYYSEAGSRFIRSLDVQMNRISDEDAAYVTPPDNAEARRTRTQEGDVLLTVTGSRIGRVAELPAGLSGSYVSQHVAILRLDRQRLRPKFLSFFLSSEAGQRQIQKWQYGQTKPGLNFRQIGDFLIPKMSIDLQIKLERAIERFGGLLGMQEMHGERLANIFSSLQSRAFSGQL